MLQASLRTGSVFNAIADYLLAKDVEVFQFENVGNLAAKPVDKKTKEPLGPSNLTAVDWILQQKGMWSHIWLLDSRLDLGSGQQRSRLWGQAFRKKDLNMSLESARSLLTQQINEIVGVQPCSPEEYLFLETAEAVKSQRAVAVMMTAGSGFSGWNQNCNETRISNLFDTGGTIPCALSSSKRRRLKKQNSEASSPCPGSNQKWVLRHAEAFRSRGEEPLLDQRPLYLKFFVQVNSNNINIQSKY